MPAGEPAHQQSCRKWRKKYFDGKLWAIVGDGIFGVQTDVYSEYFSMSLLLALAHACYWAEPGQSGVGPHTFATILASMNDLLGPGGTTWDPTVGSLGPVTPWKGLGLVITLSQSG